MKPEEITTERLPAHPPCLADELVDAEPQARPTPRDKRRAMLMLLAIVLVALNLRPALSSLAPVLADVRAGTGLSGSAAGLLTTLPVLCLGLFAPLAPRLAFRFGAERVVLWVLFLLAAGIVLRSQYGSIGLFAGTLIAGAAIGMIGVLLPGLVKREFAEQASVMTGVYTMALCLGAAVAAGLTVPVQLTFNGNWQPALAIWALPALLAALVWWPRLQEQQALAPHTRSSRAAPVRGLWRDTLAWQVTLFMGLQSSLAYCVFGWLPSILQARGVSALDSGIYLSGSVMVQVLSALAAPWLAATCFRDQRAVIALMLSLSLSGLLGTLYAPPESFWLWMVILGLGQGGGFAMALSLIVLRSPNPAVAAQLSGMVQGVGYSIAALGPFLLGVIHEASGSWDPVGFLFTLIALAAIACGLLAGRNRLVLAGGER